MKGNRETAAAPLPKLSVRYPAEVVVCGFYRSGYSYRASYRKKRICCAEGWMDARCFRPIVLLFQLSLSLLNLLAKLVPDINLLHQNILFPPFAFAPPPNNLPPAPRDPKATPSPPKPQNNNPPPLSSPSHPLPAPRISPSTYIINRDLCR